MSIKFRKSAIKFLVNQGIEVEGEEETIPITEIVQSQEAWGNYL
ncbi:hypothetical protein [Moorena producens]|nr:hypothetical protein [Moorena producens]